MHGQPVLGRDLLRPQVLLDGQRVVRAALHGGVVGDDHAGPAGDPADAGDDAGRRRRVVVDAVGGERRQLEERRAGVDQPVDALARQQLAALTVPRDGALAAAGLHAGDAVAQVAAEGADGVGVLAEGGIVGDDAGDDAGHRRRSYRSRIARQPVAARGGTALRRVPHGRVGALAEQPLRDPADGDHGAWLQQRDHGVQHRGALRDLADGRRPVRQRRARPVRVRRHDVPQHRVPLRLVFRERAVDDRGRRLGPAGRVRGRRRVRRAPAAQQALAGEGHAREAPAAVADRLAHQQQPRTGPLVQVVAQVGAPDLRAAGQVERRILVGVRVRARRPAERGDPLDQRVDAGQEGVRVFRAAARRPPGLRGGRGGRRRR